MPIPSLFCIGLPGPELDDSTRRLLDRGVGGVILFARNVRSPEQVARLCHDLKAYAGRPLLITIDQEGGRVARLREGFTAIPAMRDLGATGDGALGREVGRVLGRELKAVGIDLNFAPVMDVDSNPANPVIGTRSLARDPETVARLGVALAQGMQEVGVAACAKHFPGHGDTDTDSHLALPRLGHGMDRLKAVELLPFRAAIAGGVASIMSAHVVFEALDSGVPGTLSKKVMTDLLAGEMGFGGLRISDCMEMKAIANGQGWCGVVGASVKALQAGVDLVLISHGHDLAHAAMDAAEKALNAGELAHARVADAEARLKVVLECYAVKAQAAPDLSCLNGAAHREVAARISVGNVNKEKDPTVAIGGM